MDDLQKDKKCSSLLRFFSTSSLRPKRACRSRTWSLFKPCVGGVCKCGSRWGGTSSSHWGSLGGDVKGVASSPSWCAWAMEEEEEKWKKQKADVTCVMQQEEIVLKIKDDAAAATTAPGVAVWKPCEETKALSCATPMLWNARTFFFAVTPLSSFE